MEAKTIINISKPTTQTTDSVKALLAWRGHPTNPLPTDVGFENGRLILVLSNRKDCYYVTTAAECSCPARNWHPNQSCKHQRKHFPEQQTAIKPEAAIKQPNAGRWHGRNGPIIEDGERPFANVSSSSPVSLVDTLGDPTPGELAYYSIQYDRELWPFKA